MQRDVKFILAPPGCGKTTFLSLVRNPFFKPEWWKLSRASDSLRDADDILSSVPDHCSGKTLLNAGRYYTETPALGWDKWHRVCFRALVKYQHDNGGVGPILCGFMVGSNFEAVQSGFDKFVGEGMVESLPGVPKIRPEEIIIVLPDQATLEARGRSRSDRPVDAEHVRNCLRNYRELADRYHGRIRVVQDFGMLLN
jgi:hypothetical protein